MTQATETREPLRIILRDLEEYVGIYKGYEYDSSGFTIRFDSCRIEFFTDAPENPESLVARLRSMPVGSRIGVFVLGEGSRRRIFLRLVDQP